MEDRRLERGKREKPSATGESMVMEDNEQPPAPITEASAPEAVERPLWELSRDEQRLLIITFVGGLASIVAGACVIGGAIALVRALKPTHFLLGSLAFGTAVYIVIVVLVAKARLRRRLAGPRAALIVWLLGGLGCLYSCWPGSVWLRASSSAVSAGCPATLLPGPGSRAG